MSKHLDNCECLKSLLKNVHTEPIALHIIYIPIIINTFYETVKANRWESEDIIDMLEFSKGISECSDSVLDHYINLER